MRNSVQNRTDLPHDPQNIDSPATVPRDLHGSCRELKHQGSVMFLSRQELTGTRTSGRGIITALVMLLAFVAVNIRTAKCNSADLKAEAQFMKPRIQRNLLDEATRRRANELFPAAMRAIAKAREAANGEQEKQLWRRPKCSQTLSSALILMSC
jgi:hypothetical protein